MIAATHPVSPEEVMALADGELSGAEASSVAAYIAECAECASLAAQLSATSATFAKWTVSEAPARLEEAVRSAADQNAHGRKPGRPAHNASLSIRNWKLWAIGGSGALAGVLILVAFEVSMRYYDDHAVTHHQIAASVQQDSGAENSALPAPPPAAAPARESFADVVGQSDKKVAPAQGLAMPDLAAPSSRAQKSEALEARSTAPPPRIAEPIAPMIAHSVSLTVQVRDRTASRTTLEALLTRHRGYAAQLTVNTAEGSQRSLQGSLRVPDADLAAAIAEMRALGRVETETQSGEEVTQQHADLVARLQNSREAERRLRELLSQHTGRIEDVLQVEEEISRVRGEIEQMEADQKVLEHRVDFATIDLQLTEEYRERLGGQSASVPMQIRNALVAGLRHGASTLLGMLLFLEEALPTALIWLAILAVPGLLLWRRYRRIRAKI